jgi:adenylylsulfate kinase
MHKFHSKMTQDECRPKKKRARDEYTQTSNAQAAQRQSAVAVAAPPPLANVVWHPTSLTRADRWKNHKGAVLWFTGLSACGKSSVANQVELLLSQRNIKTYLLDGDNLRHGLCSDLAFSEAERNENLRRTAEVAKLMADSGTVVLAAFVSPYETHRERVKSIVVEGDIPFVEIYVKASLETCEQRDPKGLYMKARSGQIPDFTGISHPYEEPVSPDIVLDAETETIEALAVQVIHYLDVHASLVVANENSEQVV